MADELNVELREDTGKHKNRRLRKAGGVPAVLYGHGLDNICLSVSAEPLEAAVRRGSRLVSLTGAVNESAFVRELQWDTWSTHVLHVDFTRVAADETVEVRIAVELRGEAPGVREGGVVEHLIHEVNMKCLAIAIPEKIRVNVNSLNLDGSITVGDLVLPEDATVAENADAVVVQCVLPTELPDEFEAEGVPGEPEVIGAKEEGPAEES